MTDTRPVLVLAAHGTVAGATLAELRSRRVPVRALVRCPPPPTPDDPVSWFAGDLLDPTALRPALTGVRAALFVPPHSDDELPIARAVVAAARAAGVRLVVAGVHVHGALRRRVVGTLFPAYRPKLAIGRLVEREAPGAVLVVPANFYDNDLVFLPEILDGRFPTPLRGVNRVAVGDVAVIAADALTDPRFPAGTVPVCGPESLDGRACAAVWTGALGRPVRYTGDDAAAWAAVADRRLPAGRKGRDWRASFAVLGRFAVPTRAADVATTARLLGRPPLDYPHWVAATVRAAATEATS